MTKGEITHLNIPYVLVREALQNPELLDALKLAIAIKCLYISSVYRLHRRTWAAQIASDFHCTRAVAQRTYENAIKSDLIEDRGDVLVAKSFIKGYCKKIIPNTDKVKYAIRLKRVLIPRYAPSDIKIKDIVEKLREMLFICIVRDKKYNQLRPIYPSANARGGVCYAEILMLTDERGLVKLSFRQIAPMLGMKKSNAKNLIQKFERKGVIKRTTPGLHYVGTIEEVCEREYKSYEQLVCEYLVYEKDGLVYENPACLYSVVERYDTIYSTGYITIDHRYRRVRFKKDKRNPKAPYIDLTAPSIRTNRLLSKLGWLKNSYDC